LKVEWIETAIEDMTSLKYYLEQDNATAAKKIVKKITTAVFLLQNTPRMGRDGRTPSTKELVVSGTGYIVMYKIENDKVRVRRVLHHAMQWPDTTKEDVDNDGYFVS